MARRDRTVRNPRDIRNLGELRQMRREVEIKLWYAEERLADGIADTFSVDNLLSLFAPPGSVGDRIVGGFSTGLATIRGIINAIQMFQSRR